jgi:hypothetical protein
MTGQYGDRGIMLIQTGGKFQPAAHRYILGDGMLDGIFPISEVA